MRNIIFAFAIILIPFAGTSQVSTGSEAAILIPWMKAQDAAKIYKLQQMLQTAKEATQSGVSLVKSIQSLGDTFKQIEADARQISDLEALRGELLEEQIDKLSNKWKNTEALIDFQEVYLNSTSNMRTPLGDIDIFAALGNMEEIGGAGMTSNMSGQMMGSNNRNQRLIEDVEREYKNTMLSRMAFKEDIKDLKKESRYHMRQAILIDGKIYAQSLGLGDNIDGMGFNTGQEVGYKRKTMDELLEEQKLQLDSARQKMLEIKRLVGDPIPLPEDTRELLERSSELTKHKVDMYAEQLTFMNILNNKLEN